MPPQPAAGGSNTGESVYCFNPCLEAPFGPSILPNSLPGSTKKGSKLVKTANNVGSHTNCMSCHEMAKFPAPDTLSYTGDRYVDINDTMVDSGSSPVVANQTGRVTKSHPTRTPHPIRYLQLLLCARVFKICQPVTGRWRGRNLAPSTITFSPTGSRSIWQQRRTAVWSPSCGAIHLSLTSTTSALRLTSGTCWQWRRCRLLEGTNLLQMTQVYSPFYSCSLGWGEAPLVQCFRSSSTNDVHAPQGAFRGKRG